MDKLPIPKENVEIYHFLYVIETALRELIVESLSSIDVKWYKRRLPQPALEKYREGIKFERNINWIQLVPHHPIYYVDFTHLKEIIIRRDNWRDVFHAIFGRKEVINATLSEIEPIRNKIAHNRKATQRDLEIVKGSFKKLSEFVGVKRFQELSRKCTCACDISQKIFALQRKFETFFEICRNCEKLGDLDDLREVLNEWWFDESYLTQKIDGILEYFEALEEYSKLPRSRGTGHIIERWIKDSNIKEKYDKAKIQFEAILKGMDKND